MSVIVNHTLERVTVNEVGGDDIVGGSQPFSKLFYSATTNPGVGNDINDGFVVGSHWTNTATNSHYFCADSTAGAAVWTLMDTSAGDAPSDAQYLVLSADATLTNERVMTAGTGLGAVDSGAGAAWTLNLADTAVAPGSYGDATNVATFTVDQQGRLTAAGTAAISAGMGDPGGNGVVVRTALNTTTNRSIAVGSAKLTVANGDGVSGNPTLDFGAVAINDLSDVTIAGAASGNVLRTTDGVNWTNGPLDLTDAADAVSGALGVGNGGTGASDAATARTNLGVAIGSNVQAWDATLDSFAAYNTNGLLTQTAADTFTGRTITGTASRLSVSNGDGVAGNPTLDIDATYVGQASITTLGTITTGTWNGTDVAVTAGGTGASDAATARTNLGVAIGSNVQAWDATLDSFAAYNTNGLLTQTAADTFTGRSLTQPAAGITISNGDGVAGNPTFALANDLAAVEGLGSTGIAVRSAADTWVQRSVAGTTDHVTVSNGDGVAGNPTLSLSRTQVNTVQTTDVTTTDLATIAVASGENMTFVCQAFGNQSATGDSYHVVIHGAIKNVGGTTALVGATVIDVFNDAGAATWSISAVADDTADTLDIRVTGENAKTIDWKSRVDYVIG